MTSTYDRLCLILMRDYKLARDTLTLEKPLEDLGIDSLGIAELLFTIEDEFKVSLPSTSAPLHCIGDVVRYIDELIATQRGGDGPAAQVVSTALPAS